MQEEDRLIERLNALKRVGVLKNFNLPTSTRRGFKATHFVAFIEILYREAPRVYAPYLKRLKWLSSHPSQEVIISVAHEMGVREGDLFVYPQCVTGSFKSLETMSHHRLQRFFLKKDKRQFRALFSLKRAYTIACINVAWKRLQKSMQAQDIVQHALDTHAFDKEIVRVENLVQQEMKRLSKATTAWWFRFLYPKTYRASQVYLAHLKTVLSQHCLAKKLDYAEHLIAFLQTHTPTLLSLEAIHKRLAALEGEASLNASQYRRLTNLKDALQRIHVKKEQSETVQPSSVSLHKPLRVLSASEGIKERIKEIQNRLLSGACPSSEETTLLVRHWQNLKGFGGELFNTYVASFEESITILLKTFKRTFNKTLLKSHQSHVNTENLFQALTDTLPVLRCFADAEQRKKLTQTVYGFLRQYAQRGFQVVRLHTSSFTQTKSLEHLERFISETLKSITCDAALLEGFKTLVQTRQAGNRALYQVQSQAFIETINQCQFPDYFMNKAQKLDVHLMQALEQAGNYNTRQMQWMHTILERHQSLSKDNRPTLCIQPHEKTLLNLHNKDNPVLFLMRMLLSLRATVQTFKHTNDIKDKRALLHRLSLQYQQLPMACQLKQHPFRKAVALIAPQPREETSLQIPPIHRYCRAR